MCGRYALHAPRSEIARRYRYDEDRLGEDRPRYNITPGVDIAVLAVESREGKAVTVLGLSLWGFHPPWADNKAPTPINARAENVATSRYFRNAFLHHRCLIPASGWYEWRQTEAGHKEPFYIRHTDDELLMFAGIFQPGEDDAHSTCAIITQPAVKTLAGIHPRMPTVLDDSCWAAWLNPELAERDEIRAATKALPAEALVAYPVSTRVNRPANDDPSLIEPLRDE